MGEKTIVAKPRRRPLSTIMDLDGAFQRGQNERYWCVKRRQFLLMRSSEGRNTVTLSISNSEPQDPERLVLPTSVD
jgi:hypothetical protein